MAVRYSGDAEVRVRWDPRRRLYAGSVRDPDYLWPGVTYGRKPAGPDDYDRAAIELLTAADADCRREQRRELMVERDKRGIRVRRVFQAPCPIRPCRTSGCGD